MKRAHVHEKFNIVNMAVTPQIDLLSQSIPNCLFCRNEYTDPKIHIELQGTLDSQKFL